MFDIHFVDVSTLYGNVAGGFDATGAARPAIKSRIQIGNYWESFVSPLDVWSQEEYESQWADARRRLADGDSKSCFITTGPVTSESAVEIWGAWRLANGFRIQNLHLFPVDQRIRDLRRPYDAIRDYTNVTRDGERIYAEWSLPLDVMWMR